MTQNSNHRRELAVLLAIVLRHPAMTPVLQERFYEIFSDVHPRVDPYASAEGIELYLEAYERLDPGPIPMSAAL